MKGFLVEHAFHEWCPASESSTKSSNVAGDVTPQRGDCIHPADKSPDELAAQQTSEFGRARWIFGWRTLTYRALSRGVTSSAA